MAARGRREMARRRYLQRIAAPIAPGEPVLFPVPTPAAEDARPAVPARKPPASPAAAPSAGPPGVVRRKQAARGEISAAAQKSLPAANTIAPRNEPDPAPPAAPPPAAAPGQSHQAPAGNAEPPEDWAAWPAPAAAAPAAAAPAAAASAVEFPSATASRATSGPIFNGDSFIAPSGAADLGAADSGAAVMAPGHAAPDAAWPAERIPAPMTRRFAPPLPSEDAAPAGPQAEPPRIHIGTIEIRTTTPPAPAAPPPTQVAPPPAAPRATTASPPRGYAWRFGLIQGW